MLDKYLLKSRVYHLFWNGIDAIFPPECIGCGEEGAVICQNCAQDLYYPSLNACIYCGKPLPRRGVCPRCSQLGFAYDDLLSLGEYAGVLREAVVRLKYERDLGLARVLGMYLSRLIASAGWEADLVVPVPLSQKRKAERGYNQAEMLAIPLALELRLPLSSKALVRVRETKSQVNLTRAERRENVDKAFAAEPELVRGRTVLLVDDVFTTGATIHAAAEAVKLAGGKKILVVTVARALHRTPLDVEMQAEYAL